MYSYSNSKYITVFSSTSEVATLSIVVRIRITCSLSSVSVCE